MKYDDLICEAANLVVQHQQASPSLLQRKLKLGYNRASTIVNQLEELKIIGESKGVKARDVHFKADESERLTCYLNDKGLL